MSEIYQPIVIRLLGSIYDALLNIGGVTSISGNLVDNTNPKTPVVSLPYKKHKALYSQDGTILIIQNTLENELTGFTITKSSTGTYLITCNEFVDVTKIFVYTAPLIQGTTFALTPIISVSPITSPSIGVLVKVQKGGAASDNYFNTISYQPIEIQVYP